MSVQLAEIDFEKNQVAVFNATEVALAALREKYGTVPDVETTEGYELAKTGIKEITGYRTGLEKKRKEIKAPYLDAGKIIDAEARRITEELEALESPLKEAKQKVDEREAREKAERIAKLQAKVDAITAHIEEAKGKSADEIAAIIERVDAIDPLIDFYDLTQEAVAARKDALAALNTMYQDRAAWERMEREKKEAAEKLEEERRKNIIQQRLTNLKGMPLDLMDKSAKEIAAALEKLKGYVPPADDFGEFHDEAITTQQSVIGRLERLHAQAVKLEEVKRQEEEKEREAYTQSAGEQLAEESEQQAAEDIGAAAAEEVEPEPQKAGRGPGWSACWDDKPVTMVITVSAGPGNFMGTVYTESGDVLKEYAGVIPSCIKRLGAGDSVRLEVDIASGMIRNWDAAQILECLGLENG
jgi:hypothetical protein